MQAQLLLDLSSLSIHMTVTRVHAQSSTMGEDSLCFRPQLSLLIVQVQAVPSKGEALMYWGMSGHICQSTHLEYLEPQSITQLFLFPMTICDQLRTLSGNEMMLSLLGESIILYFIPVVKTPLLSSFLVFLFGIS